LEAHFDFEAEVEELMKAEEVRAVRTVGEDLSRYDSCRSGGKLKMKDMLKLMPRLKQNSTDCKQSPECDQLRVNLDLLRAEPDISSSVSVCIF
jgi:hypothetical protein